MDLQIFWDDDELSSCLISKEKYCLLNGGATGEQRRMAVERVMEVASRYSFVTLTFVLAVNYLDRFYEKIDTKKLQQPWITQLTCVSCLSLAAKVKETHVPLRLDLQMGRKYVFEGKTIQKMEILILSTFEWKMNHVTPLSFFCYIPTNYLSLNQRCESLLLCLHPVIARATMMHVFNNLEPRIGIQYKSQPLFGIGNHQEALEECWKKIQEITCGRNYGRVFNKRKLGSVHLHLSHKSRKLARVQP